MTRSNLFSCIGIFFAVMGPWPSFIAVIAADEDALASQRDEAALTKSDQPSLRRGLLGVLGWGSWDKSPEQFADDFQRRALKPTSGKGFFVRSLSENHADGLRENDILVRINGIQIVDEASWRNALASLRADEETKVAIKRADDGGAWKTSIFSIKPLDLERLQELQREKDEEKKKKDAAIREAHQKAVFRLNEGGTLSGAEIDKFNERVQANIVRQVLAMTMETRFQFTRGKTGLEAAKQLLESGDRKALAELVSQIARTGTARDIERVVFGQTDFDDLLVCLNDGRALTYEQLWGEAALEGARAMSP